MTASRRLRLVCAGSILLNVFLVAECGARWSMHARGNPPIGMGALRVPGADLAPAQRHGLRQVVRQARNDVRPQLDANRALRHQIAALLRAPTVDQPALLAQLEQLRSGDAAVRAHVEAQVVPYVAGLPLADRARIADRLEPASTSKRADARDGSAAMLRSRR
jgi:uncharacterized membrane protein